MSLRFVIIGGGPAGTQAATSAARLGADVTLIERDIVGGAAHLWDCVPSKAMIATGGRLDTIEDSNGALSPGTYYQAATNKYERRLVVRQAVTLDGSDVARSADSTIAQRVEVLAVDDAALCARIDAGGLSGTVRLPRT